MCKTPRVTNGHCSVLPPPHSVLRAARRAWCSMSVGCLWYRDPAHALSAPQGGHSLPTTNTSCGGTPSFDQAAANSQLVCCSQSFHRRSWTSGSTATAGGLHSHTQQRQQRQQQQQQQQQTASTTNATVAQRGMPQSQFTVRFDLVAC
jgi:hypothetical protein